MNLRVAIQNLQRALVVAAGFLLAGSAGAQTITNVQTVNVTPAGFSVLAIVGHANLAAAATTISVFSDPGGVTNLAGQVGVELYPLNSGDPTATNNYQTLLSQTALRQGAMGLGLLYARVSDCAPGTTYYYQIAVGNPGGVPVIWPTNGPLPSVTTPPANAFALSSQQLLITVNNSYPSGTIITLTASNTPSVLAAVVGDGAGANQVFFSISDLIAATGGTNYAPVGNQSFTAAVFGHGSNELAQTYELTFATNFGIGQSSPANLGLLATLVSVGTGPMLSGGAGAIPISVNSQSAVVGLSFVLNFPTNLFTAMSVQPGNAVVGGASLSLLTSNSVQISFTAAAGASLLGNRQIGQLNLTAAAHLPSAFIPLLPQSPVATNADTTQVADFSLQPGRAVIIGPQSLLDLQHTPGSLNLTLYGIPGESYQIQSTTNLVNGWSDFLLVPMTNLTQVIPNLDPTVAAAFFRASMADSAPSVKPRLRLPPSGMSSTRKTELYIAPYEMP